MNLQEASIKAARRTLETGLLHIAKRNSTDMPFKVHNTGRQANTIETLAALRKLENHVN